MQKHGTEFCHAAIKSLYPDTSCIRTPSEPVPHTTTHAYMGRIWKSIHIALTTHCLNMLPMVCHTTKFFIYIYTEILDAQYQMTRVDTTCLNLGNKKYFSRIFIANSLNNLPLKLVLPYSMFVTMMSRPQPPQITTDDDITNTQILERNSPETTRVE